MTKSKNIRVYLQYPWKTSDSQYYKSLVDYPPDKVNYVSDSKSVGMITNKASFRIRTFLKIGLRNFLRFAKISLVNLKETNTKEPHDLIHCAHCLSNNDSLWVADFEGVWQMWVMGEQGERSYKKIKETLLNKNCKKIIAWTETSKREIISRFPEVKNKIEIISYAIPSPIFKKEGKKNITLLFISRYFYNKGGFHVLEVFDTLTKKYPNVDAIFISDTPKNIEEKYSKNKKIKILPLMPYKKIVEEIYPQADIFVYPGYSDSFGFTFVEALAFGLPVVTVDGFARKDIIQNGKTGYVLEKPENLELERIRETEKKLIKDIIDKTSLLIENSKLREKMSLACLKEVKSGKFSLKERNKKLKRIYEEAIKENGK